MNKVYRTVFNETTNTWVAVAEISPAKGKKSRSEKSSGGIGLHLMAPVMVSGMLLSGHAMAAHLQDGTGTNAITISGAGVTTTEATGADSFAAGTGTKVYSQSGIALGTNVVSGDSGNSSIKNTVAIGNLAKAEGGNAIAMGQNATAKKQSDLAVGDGAKATQGQGTAVGVSASAEGAGASAYGYLTKATGYLSTAIGNQAESSGSSSVAVGKALASGPQAIAIGNDAKSTSTQTIAVGNAADVGGSQFGIAIGSGAKLNTDPAVTGKNTAIAIGYQAEATELDANAFGRKAKAEGQTSLAIGIESASKGISSIAVGANTKTDDKDGIAIGNTAATGAGHNNTAVGSYSEANVGWSTALGTRAYTNANGALAAGTMASAEGQRATAIGSFSFAEGLTSTALGYQTVATKDAVSGTAMGTGAVIDGKMSGAWAAAPHANPNLYDNSKRSIIGGEGNYAIGNENIVGNLTKNSVVFGNKIKIGADGATLTTTNPAGQGNSIKSREETVAYTNATALESVVAIGNEANVSGNSGVAVGNQSGAAKNAVAVGNNAKAKGEAIVAIGQNAGLTSDAIIDNTNTRAIMMGVNAGRGAQDINDSILIGYDAGKNLGATRATGDSSSNNIGLGARALQDASGSTNVALATEAGMGANGNNNFFGQVGAGSYVTGNNNVAIGKNAQKGTSVKRIIANDSVVLGTEGQATKDNAVAIGKGALAEHDSSVALGSDSKTDDVVATSNATINGVTYSGFAGTAPTSTVSIGKSGGERTLTNVAAGRITDTSTDAINGSQLYSVVNGLGFDVNADNDAAKTHKLGKELAIVAGNTAEPTSTSNLKTEVAQDAVTGKTTVTVSMKEAPNFTSVTTTDAAGNKTVTNGSGVTITPAAGSGNPVSLTTGGLNNGGNKITNVAAGTDGTDAVNVDQLKAAATKVTAGDGIAVTPTVDNVTGSTTYKVAVDTTPLTVANGKVTPPAAADANKLATAGDIANAINNSGFQATAGGNLASGSNATPTTVKPGQKVTFAAGNGLTVKQDIDNASGNQTYTYALDAQSVVQDAQLPVVYTKADGSKVYKQPDGKFYDAPTGGNEVPAGDVIASMQDAAGSTTAPTTLANVKSNLADAGNAVTNPAGNSRTDLAGKGNNAATVNDVLNSGFTVQGNGQNKDFVTHGDTVNFANGQGTVANVTSKNGVTTVKFDTPMTYVNASGSPTGTPSNKVNLVGGDATKPVTLGNVADGTVAAGSKEAVNGSQLHDLKEKGFKIAADNGTADTVKLTETVKYTGDSNIVTTVKDNEIGFKLADSITVGPATGGNPVKVDGNAGTVTGLTNKTWNPNNITSGRGATEDQLKAAVATTPLTVANGKVTPPAAADANKLATAGDIANAINNSGFQATAGGNLASGSNATPTTVKPGQKVTFAAGNGLTVKQDIDNASGNQTYTYALDAQSVVQDAQLPVVYTKADGTKVYKRPDGKFYDAPTGGNEVAAGNVIASMQDAAGNTTKPTTLANVKSNLADTATAVTNPTGNKRTDLAGKGNNAATVNDVLNSGFTVQGNGQNKDFVTHGDTVNFANGQGTVANVTSKNGVTTVKFDTPMTYVNASGSPTGTPSNKVNLVGGDATKPVTLGNVADGTVAAGSKEAVNGSQLHATNQNVANNAANIAKGINFGGTTGSNNYQLGDTINVKGDSNITSTTVAGGAQLALNPNLNVTSVTTTDAAGNKTVTNGSGVTITPAAGNPVSLTTGGLNNGGNKITNVAAGTAGTDAVNVDQLKVAKAAATTKVKAGNGISVNGTQNADGSTTYTVAADTTPLTVASNGKVTPPAAANKLATAGDIANAINNSGFNINAGGNVVGTSTATTAKPGSTLTLKAGDGLTVKQELDGNGNQSYTYALDAQAVVQNAQAPVVYTKADGTKVYKRPDGKFYDAPTGGNEVAAGNVIASMQDAAGNTTKPTTLANVKSNLADTATAVTNPTGNKRTDLAGKGNNAATVNDVLNSGFTVQGNGQNKDFVTHGDTVNFANGQGTVANVTSKNGVTTVKFDTPMTYVNASGSPTGTPSNKVNLVGGDATKPVTLGNVADGTVAAGSKEAVNGSQLHATNQNVANNAANIAKGINFGGTTGSNNYQLGDTINVKGDSNITSTTVAGGAQLALNPNLNVTSVTTTDAAGNKTVTNGSGVTITPAAGNPVSLTTGGLNNGGNKITNVAAGTAGTDAVNVSQLNQALGSISGANTANFTALNNKVNEVAADAKAGTAAAMAVAGLPQAYLPGKSMMAVGGSVYRGESGYAIGYSTISDGGNWIIKGTATGNSRGHYGATAAVGYQW